MAERKVRQYHMKQRQPDTRQHYEQTIKTQRKIPPTVYACQLTFSPDARRFHIPGYARRAKMSAAARRRKSKANQAEKKAEGEKLATIEYEVPDGGYGWVVVFCAFVFISMPMGVSASFAIYYEEWIEYFHAGKVRTSLVGSVGSGCVPLLGSFGGMILTNLFNDIRLVGICGCIISAVGLIISHFVNDISLLALTYGAMGGFGMGLMFNCAYLSVGYYFDKNRAFATALASSGTGFGTLISRVIRKVIITYGWRGSLIILGGICIQLLVFAALIRPLYAKKVTRKPGFVEVEEVIPKKEAEELKEKKDSQNNTPRDFSSHDGIFRPRKVSITPNINRAFSSHMQISHMIKPANHDSALHHRTGDVKLNPYARDDVFFSGSTYDIAQMKSRQDDKKSAANFASQITIESVTIEEKGCAKIKSNLRKNFNLRIFKSPTFCLVVFAMTLHHMAFFVPYTYVISLARDNGIPQSKSEYLIICFGMSNFVNKLIIGRVMTLFEVEQLYVVITTLLIGSVAASLATLCTQFYQFVLVAVLYGGTSPIVTIYLTNILVRYLGIQNLTNAFSIVTMVRGLGSMSGPPLAGMVIEMTGLTKSAFYVGTCADICSASLFGLILFINRDKTKNNRQRKSSTHSKHSEAHHGGDHAKDDSDSGVVEMENLLSPKVIVTVPTAEGNFDKLLHYSNERFDNLAVKDQIEHSKKMKQRMLGDAPTDA